MGGTSRGVFEPSAQRPSLSKVQENAKQHMYWTGIDADIEDYTK